ncbi:MAG: tyrosine recombinase XerC [Paraprevotella sp.]|nr:tyrosine recombinase XerC [Paraprevotella sp.]
MLKSSFLDHLAYEKNYSPRTVKEYSDDLKAFELYFKGMEDALDWKTLDADVIRQWVVFMMERGNSASTVSRRLSALRSFYKFLLKKKLISVNPVYGIRAPRKQKVLPVFLKEKEMNRLFDTVMSGTDFESVRDRLILLMFYMTGVRLSELIGMDVSDIDFFMNRVKVTGKRNKQRIIPVGDELLMELDAYIKLRAVQTVATPALFVDAKGQRLTKAKVETLTRYYLGMVTTLHKRSPHVLRHTFATSMLNNHAALESVKELLGHESLSTTEVYTHVTFDELIKVYNEAHPRAKKRR